MVLVFFIGLRWTLAIVLALLSLLTVCKPPSYSFWKISIIVMEAGHYFVLPCILLGLLCFFPSVHGPWSALLFLGAALLFASPALRALKIAPDLEKAFVLSHKATGKNGQRTKPISFLDLFRGVPVKKTPFKTLVYHKSHDGDLKLDFYSPVKLATPAKPAGCILVIHGGGWDGGARSQLPTLNHFLAQGGYAVASLEYRLAPKHQYPAPIEDVSEALAYLTQHASELGIDPARFVLVGRSAGGQIALQAAYTSHNPNIKGVISFYAPADMVFGYQNPTHPLIMNSCLLMEQYLGGTYSQYPERYLASSPFEQLTNTGPPTLLLHGRADVLVSYQHTVHMQSRMEAVGMKSFVVDFPWGAHGYDFVFRGPGSQISLYFLERFLDMVLP